MHKHPAAKSGHVHVNVVHVHVWGDVGDMGRYEGRRVGRCVGRCAWGGVWGGVWEMAHLD